MLLLSRNRNTKAKCEVIQSFGDIVNFGTASILCHGDVYNISKASVSRVVRDVSVTLSIHSKRYVEFSPGNDVYQYIDITGAIDCIHTKSSDEHLYVNRKVNILSIFNLTPLPSPFICIYMVEFLFMPKVRILCYLKWLVARQEMLPT